MDVEMTESAPSSQNVVSDQAAETHIQDVVKSILRNNLDDEAKDLFPESCRLLKVILQNIHKNPQEQKFRLVKTKNPKFDKFVGKFSSGVIILEILGFQHVQNDEDPFLICTNDDVDIFREVVFTIDKVLEKFENQPKFDFIEPEPVARKISQVKRESKVPKNNDMQSQIREYRNKQKRNEPKIKKIWTLDDIRKLDESKASDEREFKNKVDRNRGPGNSNPRMNQVYDSVASFTEPRNLMLRAFELSNQFRVAQGKKQLIWDEGLSRIAYEHSKNMGDGKVPFGHKGFNQRYARFPFIIVRGGAENVAYNYGHGDPSKVCVDGWIDSPGHRKNLIGHFDYMAIGLYINQSGYYYYTQLFALI